MIPRNELIARLLAAHQRMTPHHTDQCQLCKDATAAVQEPAEPIAYAVMQDGKCIEATTSRACAERWLPHAPRTIEPLYVAPVAQQEQGERKPDFWYRDKQGMLTLIDHAPGPEYGSGWKPLYE